METKKWFLSKTLWANVVVLALVVISALTDFFVSVGLSTEVLISLTAAANIILRFLTNKSIRVL